MKNRIKELNEERGRLWTEYSAITAKAAKEERHMTADEKQKFDELFAKWQLASETLTAEQQVEEARKASAEVIEEGAVERKLSPDEYRAKVNDALRVYVFRGKDSLSPDQISYLVEKRASKTLAEGGATVDTLFQPEVEKALLAYGGIVGNARLLFTNTGADWAMPMVNDTANTIRLIAEGGAVNINATDPTWSQHPLKAYKFGTDFLPITRELEEDSELDIVGYLIELFKERIARGMNKECTTGNGSSRPQGIVTGAYNSGVLSSDAGFTYNNLLDLQFSVDPDYQSNAKFMFNWTTLKAICKLVDDNNLPLFKPTPRDGNDFAILGKPYIINQDVATFAKNAKFMLYGDFNKFFVRMVKGIRIVRTEELYRTTDSIGIGAFLRFDSRLADAGTHPVKYMAVANT